MKKLLIVFGLGAIFILSSMYSANLYIKPENMGQLLGLGAMVVAYFALKLLKQKSTVKE